MLKIEYLDKFDSILCLDGNSPPLSLFDLLHSVPIFAADGASLRLHEMGIKCNYIIGDLDSFHANQLHLDINYPKIIFKPDQESNDFEKCLVEISELGFGNTLITGFHGGVLEHSLNNVSVLLRYSHKMNLCILDADRYCFAVNSDITMSAEDNEIISLIPQPKATLTTTGLYWQLNHEELEIGVREGARNQAILPRIEVIVHHGELLFSCNSRLPFSPFGKNH